MSTFSFGESSSASTWQRVRELQKQDLRLVPRESQEKGDNGHMLACRLTLAFTSPDPQRGGWHEFGECELVLGSWLSKSGIPHFSTKEQLLQHFKGILKVKDQPDQELTGEELWRALPEMSLQDALKLLKFPAEMIATAIIMPK